MPKELLKCLMKETVRNKLERPVPVQKANQQYPFNAVSSQRDLSVL